MVFRMFSHQTDTLDPKVQFMCLSLVTSLGLFEKVVPGTFHVCSGRCGSNRSPNKDAGCSV